ncbi:reverse transcriptase zinc-binding domain-containing protein [Artemisia annua]|uniref:Reverse transcriptase zinc-binding domain-containing protein n=1 Tax=Artemisia annua TaxID=35608 RepID=A0A2U1MII5_ARTAN|nr:reverse transcriptase zinc-binding domain-containing protein [Artemisia annua]
MALMDSFSNNLSGIIYGLSIRPANNTIWSVIQRLLFGVAIYFVWQERNFRIYQQKERSVNCLFDHIVDTVRLKIRGLTLKQTNEVIKASQIWNLPINNSVYYRDIVRDLNSFDDSDGF